MRRTLVFTSAILLAFLAVTGCGQRAEQAQEISSADSLLATNPTEQTSGDLTPQQSYEQAQEEPPAPTTPAATRPPVTSRPKPAPQPAPDRGVEVPAGTALAITMTTPLTSETAQEGDAWSGTVKEPVIIGTDAPIPAGSTVHGVVRAALPAERGNRAFLVLAVTSVEVNGKRMDLDASADTLVASSPRARNVGAVAGGAAAGALLGKAIGGNKGALIGGVLGGAGAAGAVAKTKGYQSTVKEGQEITFRVDRNMRLRS